jgi:UDPglucose 6-dehydrogenase
MNITIIGTGYVGLVTGACLAELGNFVCCLDIDQHKIDMLEQGEIPFHEPGLAQMVTRNQNANRLFFTSDTKTGIEHGDIQFIAVGTPSAENGSADLHYVLAAARSIGQHMTEHKIVIDKSTVPVGTAEKVQEEIQYQLKMRNKNITFSVISNPEFLKEGAAIEDFMYPDRIVIGSDDTENGLYARTVLKSLYAPFNRNHERTIWTDVRSAEFTKYAANAMLATRISFMNELANLADSVGADIEAVRHGIGSDPRIGYSFLYAGCGYGGSCFPKDVQALRQTAREYGQELFILSAVDKANEEQKCILGKKIVLRFGADLRGRHFTMWGLAFKPNTDDMREAPSRVLLSELINRGATVSVFDPVAMNEAKRVLSLDFSKSKNAFERIHFSDDPMEALNKSDALIIVTEWKTFNSPDFERIKEVMKTPIVFDGRNIYDPQILYDAGFEYYGIGRATPLHKRNHPVVNMLQSSAHY